ncbi:MAG: hypothetical protein PVH61_41460 [Candidatus Aminicenantes bacterium]|jgi:hypothetical protein
MKQLIGLIIFLIFFLTFPGRANAGKIVPLAQLEKPNSITVDKNHVYITDQGTISIYSLKDFKLKKTFGKKGEGPGEFKLLPQDKIGLRIAVNNDYILVNSAGRLSFFTKTGEFKDQFNLIDPVQFLKPLGKKFVGFKGIRYENLLFIAINLYTLKDTQPKGVRIEKEIWRKEHYGQMTHIPDCLKLAMATKDESRRGALYRVYNNHIFIEGNNNEIHVFDDSGEKQYTIHHDYEKIKVPDSFKQKVMAFFEKRYPTIYRMARHQGKFPEYFPIRYFHAADNKIYVLTFKNQDNKSEIYLLDVKGKFLKKVMVPFAEAEFLLAYPYTITNGQLYQLQENPDTEEWELHIHEIN